MKQEEWTTQLRKRLADHEEPAPEGLWASIEHSLPTRPARTVPLRHWLAAAALLAFISGAVVWIWRTAPSSSEPAPALAAATPPEKPMEPRIPANNQSLHPSHPDAPSPLARADVRPTPTAEMLPTALTALTATQGPNEADAPMPQDTPSAASHTAAARAALDQPQASDVEAALEQAIADMDDGRKKGHRHTAQLGLYAGNALDSYEHSNGVLMSDEMARNYASFGTQPSYALTARGRQPIYLANYGEQQKHHRPWSVGLSLSYPLTPRLALATGVAYTRLNSDFRTTANTTEILRQQRLQYVGVPLQLQWQLWNRWGFRAYATAGGQADWNVKSESTIGSAEQAIGKDNCQWSALATLGLQYDIIPQLGLFAEPGVRHYFDNGSSLQNYFKEKPTQFSLQLGLRCNLSR